MSLQGITIVVAENEPEELDFISTVLADSGAEVTGVQNGTLALQKTREHRPRILTLDIAMPGVEVTELLDTVRNDPELAAIKVCVISGRPELRGFLFDRDGGHPNAFLDKPFTPQELVAKIEDLVTD